MAGAIELAFVALARAVLQLFHVTAGFRPEARIFLALACPGINRTEFASRQFKAVISWTPRSREAGLSLKMALDRQRK
jgi:hypothetical protein